MLGNLSHFLVRSFAYLAAAASFLPMRKMMVPAASMTVQRRFQVANARR
jgi:hypothetical protein